MQKKLVSWSSIVVFALGGSCGSTDASDDASGSVGGSGAVVSGMGGEASAAGVPSNGGGAGAAVVVGNAGCPEPGPLFPWVGPWMAGGPHPGPCSLSLDGAVTTYEYDERGVLLRGNFADGGVEAYERDAQGRIVSVDDGVIRYEYDYSVSGEIVETRVEQGVRSNSYTYILDATGRPVALTSERGIRGTYSYRDCRPTLLDGMVEGTSWQATFVYDAAGNLVARESTSGTLNFDYSCW